MSHFRRTGSSALESPKLGILSVTATTVDLCAAACLLYGACKSFDFEHIDCLPLDDDDVFSANFSAGGSGGSGLGSGGKFYWFSSGFWPQLEDKPLPGSSAGKCTLFVDSSITLVSPHMMVQSSEIDHYDLATSEALLHQFNRRAYSFAPFPPALPESVANGAAAIAAAATLVSPEVCAHLCLQEPQCGGFASGVDVRKGECQLHGRGPDASCAGTKFRGNADSYVAINHKGEELEETTLEVWLYPRRLDGWRVIRNDVEWNTGDVHYQFKDGTLEFSLRGNSPVDQWFSFEFEEKTWYHLAIVYSKQAKTVQLYIDGELDEILQYESAVAFHAGSARIGSWHERYFDGYMREFRLWKVARSGYAIRQHYLQFLTGAEAGLLSVFPLDATARDLTGSYSGEFNAEVGAVDAGVCPWNGLLANSLGGLVGRLESMDLYSRNTLPGERCGAGQASSTGFEPGCNKCIAASYVSDDQTRCLLCPPGTGTALPGATTADACMVPTCPEHTQQAGGPPDNQNDCTCLIDSLCRGPKCRTDPNTGIVFFHASCDTCSCSEPKVLPAIEGVSRPHNNAIYHSGDLLEVAYEASSAVSLVHIGLYLKRDDGSNFADVVVYICTYCHNSGRAVWTIPPSIASSGRYMILVMHAITAFGDEKAPTHRNSFEFEIVQTDATLCFPGYFNKETGGKTPGCLPCKHGTFSADDRTRCTACPEGTSTESDAAATVDDCTVGSDLALFQFNSIPRHYLSQVAAAGIWMELDEHVTVNECAQRCLDNGGCKSFSAGIPGEFQAGDCFLNYDDRTTVVSVLLAKCALGSSEGASSSLSRGGAAS